MNRTGSLNIDDIGIFTDLYELKMAESFFRKKMFTVATFSLFVRSSSNKRSYYVSAGLNELLHYVEQFCFSDSAISYLESTNIFSKDFLDYLSDFSFTGAIRAIPEGRVFFKNEPLLEVTAPIIQSQLIETLVVNQMNVNSLISTKAARCFWAAGGRRLVDFSLRRAHGVDAGMIASRSSYLAGFTSTSNVLAGRAFDIPITGTMAHSYVASFENEIDSFRTFSEHFPGNTVLLLDTYDTVQAAHKAVTVALEMESRGHRMIGVRIDSGDLVKLSIAVREILDQAGLTYISILVSGGLDEKKIEKIVDSGAPVDAFGVGTQMGISGDAPSLDMAYKLVKYGDRAVMKLSSSKESLPNEKQVFRLYGRGGAMVRDVICLKDENYTLDIAEPMLYTVMEDGKRVKLEETLTEIRDRFHSDFAKLPDPYKALRNTPTYPVFISPELRKLYIATKNSVLPPFRLLSK